MEEMIIVMMMATIHPRKFEECGMPFETTVASLFFGK
jgi:low temperature requirement protein LtrA